MIGTALVDLDGTIIDPKSGIFASFRHALGGMGMAQPDGDLNWIIGPPLRVSFAEAGVPAEAIERALNLYRAYYSAGAIFDALVYPDMREALAQIREDGVRLILATSKLRDFAVQILEHFKLSDLFDAIHGASAGGSLDDKGNLLAHIKAVEGVDFAHAVMIGDRMYDINAAKRHDAQSIGVLWGYGARKELEEAGAGILCAVPSELPAVLRSLASELEPNRQ